ncbi:putative carboxypeptidase [Triangularia setosa]|uniref:Carboxypeptidase n=1 Tax=Triangularia setosa TaxID=2587417 RepID=A0AAN6W1Q7_9PEZI|nr:putative carboxypeptidase [Podospora setosa]
MADYEKLEIAPPKTRDIMADKQDEPRPPARARRNGMRIAFRELRFWYMFLGLIMVLYQIANFVDRPLLFLFLREPDFKGQCAQPEPLFPGQNEELDRLVDIIEGDAFRNASVDRLSGAVQVKTESFDDLGEVGQDPRWEVFFNFHKYLEKTFPLIYERLLVEKINTHGLLYTWKGSDDSLKPTLLMAHQDTVPVPSETIGSWTHPPWSGAYDGKYVWGRGAADCKNSLIALLETLQLLLEANFQPKRTILLSFGFDEEVSGRRGAATLSAFIQDRYGKNGVAVIVDEGAGFEETWGTLFAKPGTAEKGYVDVKITVRMPGGHSSIPSDHTSIGVLSELIVKIESEQYPTRLVEENPYYSQLQCGAGYSESFPKKLKKLLADSAFAKSIMSPMCHNRSNNNNKPDRLALEAAKQGPAIKYLMQTSQAVDVISGGIKTNALPERATVTVNHRINIGETTKIVTDRLTSISDEIAKKYNLTLQAFDGSQEKANSIHLSSTVNRLEVAPITPADGSTNSPFTTLAGTVRAVYGKNVIVTPGIMTGNTDTRYYWDLTRHIFRFAPGYDADDEVGLGKIHTVDERVSVLNHIHTVRWFVTFVRNMDEARFDTDTVAGRGAGKCGSSRDRAECGA